MKKKILGRRNISDGMILVLKIGRVWKGWGGLRWNGGGSRETNSGEEKVRNVEYRVGKVEEAVEKKSEVGGVGGGNGWKRKL